MPNVRRIRPAANDEPTLAEWQQARIDVARLMRRHGKGEDTIDALRRINAAIERLQAGDDIDREIDDILKGAA